jgi:hypothetical protein
MICAEFGQQRQAIAHKGCRTCRNRWGSYKFPT